MIIPEDLLNHSRDLYSETNKSEIVLRNVARNAYYALFHKLTALELPSIPNKARDYGSHELLIQQLRKSYITEYRQWGLKLASMKTIRTKADYKVNVHFSDHDAYSAFRKVERIFEECLLQENPEQEKLSNDSNQTVSQDIIPTKCRPSLVIVK